MKVLVIIVNYNGSRWIPQVCEALRGEEESLREDGVALDLFVFDNASGDGSAELWAEAWPGVILQQSEGNLGFTAGNNAGFRYALDHGYNYVYLLNQDAWPCPGAISQLMAWIHLEPSYAMLSPQQLRRDGEKYDPNFQRDVVARAREEKVGYIYRAPHVMAAHWLVSCAALRTIGLFEPLLPLYGQDDNWCDRAFYHGYKVGYLETAQAIHDRADRKEPKDRIIYRNYYMGSLVRLLDIRRPLWTRRLYVCLFTLVKTVKYGSLQPLKYHRDIRRQLPEIRAARETTRNLAAYV